MAVRNFYIAADIDGRKARITGGPHRKDGGFDLTVTMRSDREIMEAVSILGRADAAGHLTLTVQDARGLEVHKVGAVR